MYVLPNRKSLHNRDYLDQKIVEAGRQGSPASFRRAVGVKFVELKSLLYNQLCIRIWLVIRGVAQFGSALDWGSRGRWFKSSRPEYRTIR